MDLVILAAGMGSRFGGNKQTEPVDDDGNFILDYSVYGAAAAGFDRVVLVIRKEHKHIFDELVGKRLGKIIDVAYAFQDINDVPKGVKIPSQRTKPWGTAHALYACRDIVSDRFAVINADDFYHVEGFKMLAKTLRNMGDDEVCSLGYVLKSTLSKNGGLKRGIFEVKGDYALNLTESKVELRGNKIYATPLNEDNYKLVKDSTLASMTAFGFSKTVFKQIKKMQNAFFSDENNLVSGECLLPDVVRSLIEQGVKVKILRTNAPWFGMTYREDLPLVKQNIEELKRSKAYPKHLY